MANNYFQFKHFLIRQDTCAMKVGTDGVLLGAWAVGFPAARALDVGTGTGLLALILAASGVPHVEAVELDEGAFFQASANVSESGFSAQVSVANISFQQFASALFAVSYNLIISNPPYYSDSLKSFSSKRSLARHDDTLSIPDLLDGVKICLAQEGVFAVIIPSSRMQELVTEACARGLYLRHRLLVKTRDVKEVSRVLLAFRQSTGVVQERSLTIYSGDGSYTDDYKKITENIYCDSALRH